MTRQSRQMKLSERTQMDYPPFHFKTEKDAESFRLKHEAWVQENLLRMKQGLPDLPLPEDLKNAGI